MSKAFLKPANAGDVIRDPVTKAPLPPEGAGVVLDTLWRRRLARKEVVQTTAEAVAKGKAARLAAEAKAAAKAEAEAKAAAPETAAKE